MTTRTMPCSRRSHSVARPAHRAPRTSSICTVSRCSTCLGANFPSGTRRRESRESDKASPKCFRWLILNNCLDTTVSKWTREAKRILWHLTNTRRFQRMVKWWWREDCRQMARTQHQDSTNRIEDKSSLIRTDQEVHRSSRPDHS